MSILSVDKHELFADEASLWKAFQQGDMQAFDVIYQKHASSLLSYGKRLCSDADLVKDLVQDVFVEIWTRRANLRDLHTIKFYLFKILRNKVVKEYRATAHFVGEEHPSVADNLLAPSIEFLITQQETNT